MTDLMDMAAVIKAELAAGRSAGRTAVEHFVKAGQHLIKVKVNIPHGQWLPWLEANCDLSERSAQGYMSLAKRWAIMTDKRRDEVALLGLREALKETANRRSLSAPVQSRQNVGIESKPVIVIEAQATEIDAVTPANNKVDIEADTIEEPPEWTSYRAFAEDDPKRRDTREKWRNTGYLLSDILSEVDVEDAEWLIKLLQWRIEDGHYHGEAA
ncbi:MAG: DUF3102 domain-containing protein [Parvibaculaceae bacterium]